MIPPNDLIEGGVYELRSRNLLVGVYHEQHWRSGDRSGVSRCFIGIRQKFGYYRLDVEVLNDPPGTGTAVAEMLLGHMPNDLDLREGHSVADERGGHFETNRALADALMHFDHPEGKWWGPEDEVDV